MAVSGSEAPAYLVYGGASSLNHKGMRVLSWSDLSELSLPSMIQEGEICCENHPYMLIYRVD